MMLRTPFPPGTHGKAELQSCPWGWWDQQAVGRRADGRHPQDPSLSSALWVTMGTPGQEAELPEDSSRDPRVTAWGLKFEGVFVTAAKPGQAGVTSRVSPITQHVRSLRSRDCAKLHDDRHGAHEKRWLAAQHAKTSSGTQHRTNSRNLIKRQHRFSVKRLKTTSVLQGI